jgi:large subunit ribosomal protein L21
MYAIVEIAGKQFRVAKDMKLKVPVIQADAGKSVDFDQVFMVEDDKGNITLGKPLVKNTSVSAKIIEHSREKKIIVFKKKRRKGYQKKNGHRQGFSMIEITGIGAAKKVKETKAVVETPKKAKTETAKSAARTETKPAKKAPAKKKTVAKATTTEKKPAAAKKTPAKKATKTASSAPKKDIKED